MPSLCNFFIPEREINNLNECYRFIGKWSFIECNLLSEIVEKYDLPSCLLPEEDAEISNDADINDDDLANLLKFLFIKNDNKYYLNYGYKTLVFAPSKTVFFLKVNEYFEERQSFVNLNSLS